MRSRVSDVLERAAPGRALTVFCEDVRTTRPELRAATEELASVPTLVALEWARAPALASELDEIRDALARAALSLWPNWYLTAEQRFERGRHDSANVSEVLEELRKAEPKASAAWLKRAWPRASKRQAPLVAPLTSAEQVRQLCLALDPQSLVFVLSVEHAEASEARVRGLSRAAEWLAYESQAKVILLLPLTWQTHRELDHVAYQSLTLPLDGAATLDPGATPPAAADGSTPRVKSKKEDAPAVLVGPIIGQPHPASEVEQVIHAQLMADPELSPLFEFNQRLTVYGDKHYVPDILWRQGGLVIELDGDEHCRPHQYTRDRDRDYRMYMSGFLTLRITNAEVSTNPEGVLEKIRNVVSRLKLPEKTRSAHGLPT